MNPPDNLPPLPPETRYGGLVRSLKGDCRAFYHTKSEGYFWIGPVDLCPYDGPPGSSGDWHVALPIEAVREPAKDAADQPAMCDKESALEPSGVEARVCETMSDRPTPLTDAAEHHSGPDTCTALEGMVDAEFARDLERQRDHYLRQSASLIGKLADMNIRRHVAESERDAYAETLRNIAWWDLPIADTIRERHPELAKEGEKGQP